MFLNTRQRQRYRKLLVYGESGTGKTHLGVTAPDPLILLGERQGYETVRDAADRLRKPLPPTIWVRNKKVLDAVIDVLASPSKEPIADILRLLAGPDRKEMVEEQIKSLPYARPKTIVLDSMTEFSDQVFEAVSGTAKPKIASDGLPDVGQRVWGEYSAQMLRVIRQVRDLPYAVLMLALKDDKIVGEGQEASRQVGPSINGRKTGPALAGAVNAVGMMQIERVMVEGKGADGKTEKKQKLRRSVLFIGPSHMMLKPIEPLENVEVANVESWIERLDHKDDGKGGE